MPKFASTLKALIGNKEKISEMARTPMNEHCSAVILNKLPKKLGDPRKFLIPCEFPGMDECLALADLDRTESKPVGIAKDVKVKVGVFHFPADFVVIDFKPDPRVPLILRRCFLKTSRALIDVHMGELTLRIRHEAITYNLDQTSRYSANYDQMTANKIDVTDEACEAYSQEVLGFSDVTASGSPTPSDDPIVSTTSPTLTPFGDGDFLLFEEADAFLGLEDDPDSLELDPSYYDPEGDILSLEAILNSDHSPPLPNHEQSVPSFKEELKAKLNEATRKDHFPLPFIDQMLERLAGNEYYCFLDGFSGYFQILIDPRDQEKTTFTCPTGRSPIVACLSVYAMHRARFKGDAKARLLRWVLLLQEFDFTVIDTKGAENLAADHLSRLEHPYENVLDPKEINENFPLETLGMVTLRGDSGTP
nr:reverse transcriptase domain-containing protein [Tanacetum cinerariifolium]